MEVLISGPIVRLSGLGKTDREKVLATAQPMRAIARQARPDDTLAGKIVVIVTMGGKVTQLANIESGVLQLGGKVMWYENVEYDDFDKRNWGLERAQLLGDLIVFHATDQHLHNNMPRNLTVPVITCGNRNDAIRHLAGQFAPELNDREKKHVSMHLEDLRAEIYVSMALIVHVLGAVV